MNQNRISTAYDSEKIGSLFKLVRDSARFPAHYNWTNEQIDQETLLSNFYLNVEATGSIRAFIAYRILEDSVEIMSLGTHPDFLRQRIMLRLLKGFVQNFSSQEQQVSLEVHEKNLAAISLYNRCGFKLLRQRQDYYRDGGAALVMTTSS